MVKKTVGISNFAMYIQLWPLQHSSEHFANFEAKGVTIYGPHVSLSEVEPKLAKVI